MVANEACPGMVAAGKSGQRILNFVCSLSKNPRMIDS